RYSPVACNADNAEVCERREIDAGDNPAIGSGSVGRPRRTRLPSRCRSRTDTQHQLFPEPSIRAFPPRLDHLAVLLQPASVYSWISRMESLNPDLQNESITKRRVKSIAKCRL